MNLHDFCFVAVGSRGGHLYTLDVVGVNSIQVLQAQAAQFCGHLVRCGIHGRRCGDKRLG